jgi:hypothetical protein
MHNGMCKNDFLIPRLGSWHTKQQTVVLPTRLLLTCNKCNANHIALEIKFNVLTLKNVSCTTNHGKAFSGKGFKLLFRKVMYI